MNSKTTNVVSFTTLFVVFCVVSFSVTLLLSTIILVPSAGQILESTVEQELESEANLASAYLNQYLMSRVRNIHDIAAMPMIVTGALQTDVSNTYLSDYLQTLRVQEQDPSFFLVNIMGGVIARESEYSRDAQADFDQLTISKNIVTALVNQSNEFHIQFGRDNDGAYIFVYMPVLYGISVEAVLIAKIPFSYDDALTTLFQHAGRTVTIRQNDFVFTHSNSVLSNASENRVIYKSRPLNYSQIVLSYGYDSIYLTQKRNDLLQGIFFAIVLSMLLAFVLLFFIGRKLLVKPSVALQAIQERLSLAFEGSGDGPWDWDVLSNRMLFSDRMKEMLGYYQVKHLSKEYDSLLKLVHLEDQKRFEQALTLHLSENKPFDIELRLKTLDKGWHWFRTRGQAIWGKDNKPYRMVGSIQDIQNLKEQEEQLRVFEAVVKNTSELVVVSSAVSTSEEEQLEVIFVNDAFIALTGCVKSQVLGNTINYLTENHELTDLWSQIFLSDDMRENSPQFKSCSLLKQGQIRSLDVLSFPVFDQHNQLRYLVTIGRDTTEERQVKNEINQIAQLALNNPHPMIQVQTDFKLLFINPAGYELFDGVGNWPNCDLFHQVESFLQDALNTQRSQQQEIIYHNTFYQVTFTPFLSGDQRGVILYFTDVSTIKEAEKNMAEAKKQAEHSNAMKSEFLAMISHEIRTPLNGISGMTELLAETQLDKKQIGFVNNVLSSTDALMTIINDLLDFSKIESGKIDLEIIEFNLRQCCEEVISLLSTKLNDKSIEIVLHYSPHIPIHVMGDKGRVRQVLLNLIGNSVKFTEHGFIKLTVTQNMSIDPHNQLFHFSVQDTGIGIPKEVQHKIFEKFSQADSSVARRYGGTGLGLAICKRLVHMMEGEIMCTSEYGQGSVFEFTVHLENAPHASDRTAPVAALTGVKLLLVDTLQANREMLIDLVEFNQASCDCVIDFEAAALQIQSHPAHYYDFIIVCDYTNELAISQEVHSLFTHLLDDQSPAFILISNKAYHSLYLSQAKNVFHAVIPKPVFYEPFIQVLVAVKAAFQAGNRQCFFTVDDVFDEEVQRVYHPVAQVRALYVDDDRITRLIAIRSLEKVGCDVVQAINGFEALNLIKNDPDSVDIIFMDTQMPIMDGFEATQAICQFFKSIQRQPIPIVMVTADLVCDIDLERAMVAGAVERLQKPLETTVLQRVLESHVPSAFASVDSPKNESDIKVKILVVEDSPINRLYMNELLEKLGCSVEFAVDGQEGVEQFKRGQFDLVLMDLQMPVKDGYTATLEIRAWEKENQLEHTPIVAITANITQHAFKRSMEVGVDAHFTKPIKMSQVKSIVKTYAKRHKETFRLTEG